VLLKGPELDASMAESIGALVKECLMARTELVTGGLTAWRNVWDPAGKTAWVLSKLA